LAKEIASYCPTADIEIYEPHASHFTYDNIADFNNIKIVDELNNKKYDYIFTTDVFEHIEDPISLIINFNRYLRNEGVLVAAWNFTSCIKCHLPKHFHFRYTMHRWIISSLGFLYIGKAKGGHGYVFKKVKEVNRHLTKRCYELALISKTLYPIFRVLSFGKKMIKDITGGSGDL
jgi:2-polyprenyl-6-hydroxyphenyl methylase/3-demethylubiquinone-9 3-methyltransferase